MRAFWLLLSLLTFSLGAKDNFIFDYRNDPMALERIERIEREIGEMKASVITLQKAQEKSVRTAPAATAAPAQTKKLEESIAALKRDITRLEAAQKSLPSKGASATDTARLDALSEALFALRSRMDETTGATVGKGDLAPLSMQIDLLNEKLLGLDLAMRENYAASQSSAGLPFDRYLPVTKAHVEYFVMGLLIVLAILFLMLIAALGRGKRAEEKIAQLVKLYQSSSKKIDDRK